MRGSLAILNFPHEHFPCNVVYNSSKSSSSSNSTPSLSSASPPPSWIKSELGEQVLDFEYWDETLLEELLDFESILNQNLFKEELLDLSMSDLVLFLPRNICLVLNVN